MEKEVCMTGRVQVASEVCRQNCSVQGRLAATGTRGKLPFG